jgi:hypothetical protein
VLTRADVIERLRALAQHEVVRAAWLDGSDANARTDERSDVDLVLVAREVEAAFEAVREALEALSPIRIAWRLPMPTWHGFDQCFYQLERAPDFAMVDLVVLEVGKLHPWLEVERHGTPLVLFDNDGVVREAHVDRDAIRRSIRESIARLRVRFALFHHLPVKLAARELPVDAIAFYHSMILKPLVDVLRAVHCPDRWDFGFRYVKDDLPSPLVKELERLAYPSRASEIPKMVEDAKAIFERELEVAEKILNP